MRLLWPLLLSACSQGPAIAPGRIVSNNPCIDAVLAEVADPATIGAISRYSQDEDGGSAPIGWARRFPAIGSSAEEIIAARPRLVLTGNYASTGTNAALARAGVRVEAFGVPATLEESRTQVMAIARAIGREREGAKLVARMNEATQFLPGTGRGTARRGVVGQGAVSSIPLAAPPPLRGPPPRAGEEFRNAIIWQTGGFVAGQGTIQDEMLARAGFRNASATYGLKQWDVLPLETLLRNPPDLIFTPVSAHGDDARSLALRQRILRHLKGRTRIVAFPDKLLFCGGPTVIAAMQVLRAAEDRP